MINCKEVALPALVGTLGLVVTIYTIERWRRSSSKQVSGPRGWPIVGHLHYLLPAKLDTNMKWLREKYGPIFKLKFGSFDAIILTDFEHIKRAWQRPELSYRPTLYLFEFASRGYHGLLSSNGELWSEHRRFTLRHLRDLGMGKSSIEVHIQREALDMMETLKKTLGQPIDFNNNLNISITNIVWALIAGKRMAHDDPVFLGFMAAIRNNMETAGTSGIVGFIPWLKDVFPRSWLGVDRMEDSVDRIYSYFETIIKEHEETFDPNDLRDYTDYFIDEQRRQGENSTFTKTQLLVSMGDLFVAGGETTATTLRWAFLLLSYHPEMQRRVQEEIDAIVGRERLPTLHDRERMPYTDAVIHEVQRFSDIAPFTFHANGEADIELEGFIIPKGTMIAAYMGDCHRGEKYWAKPNQFYPEHFLDEKGQFKKNIEGYIPFSIGKRRCIGENLARLELFYFITYFLQSFNFTLCQTDPVPSLDIDPAGGVVRWPKPYKVVMQLR